MSVGSRVIVQVKVKTRKSDYRTFHHDPSALTLDRAVLYA